MQKQCDKRPEDDFIDRYMPGASEEERENARVTLNRVIKVLIQVDDRLAREAREADSREVVGGGRVDVGI